MSFRFHLLMLVGVVGAAQLFAASQTTEAAFAARRDVLLPERSTSERTVERLSALQAAGGVDAAAVRATEAIRCDSLSFAGGGPVCHTPAPELRVERAGDGELRVAAVRQTEHGARIVARARVRGLARDELRVDALP